MEFLSFARRLIVVRLDDDFVDRLNYYYTPSLLLIFGLLLSAQQWVGQPIECWVPAQFNSAWEEYTGKYLDIHRDEKQLSYYQWVPFILGLMAFFFHLPYAIWNVLNWQNGLNIHGLCAEAGSEGELRAEEPEEDAAARLDSLAAFIDRTLARKRLLGEEECAGLPASGHYVATLNLTIKVLFALNSFGQLFFMNKAFSSGRVAGGSFWVFADFLRGQGWELSGSFPRTTICDFQVRVLGNLHRHTVQCLLLINMFNDKIFLFLWCWLSLLFVLSVGNFLYWLGICVNPRERVRYVAKYICNPEDELTEFDYRTQRKFALRHLRQDGVFLMRRIAAHAGNIVAAKLLRRIYLRYKHRRLNPNLHESIQDSSSSSPSCMDKEKLEESDFKQELEAKDNRGPHLIEEMPSKKIQGTSDKISRMLKDRHL